MEEFQFRLSTVGINAHNYEPNSMTPTMACNYAVASDGSCAIGVTQLIIAAPRPSNACPVNYIKNIKIVIFATNVINLISDFNLTFATELPPHSPSIIGRS